MISGVFESIVYISLSHHDSTFILECDESCTRNFENFRGGLFATAVHERTHLTVG